MCSAVIPVAFHCDSTGENLIRQIRNSWINSASIVLKCPISKFWGSLILEPKAWTPVSCIQRPFSVGKSASCHPALGKQKTSSFHRKPSLSFSMYQCFTVPQSRPQIPTVLGNSWLMTSRADFLSQSYPFPYLCANHVMGILSHSAWISAYCSQGPNFATTTKSGV